MSSSPDTLVLDSSCWIAWLDPDDGRADQVDEIVETFDGRLAVPSVVVFEVDRWLRRNERIDDATRHDIVARMRRERSLPLDHRAAVRAGALAHDHGLATADALIAGCSRAAHCELATFDGDFASVPHARVLG